MTVISTNYNSASPQTFQLGEWTWTGDIDENDLGEQDGEPLGTTYTLYLEHMTEPNIIGMTLEVTLDWLTEHGIVLYERGVPLEDLTN